MPGSGEPTSKAGTRVALAGRRAEDGTVPKVQASCGPAAWGHAKAQCGALGPQGSSGPWPSHEAAAAGSAKEDGVAGPAGPGGVRGS